MTRLFKCYGSCGHEAINLWEADRHAMQCGYLYHTVEIDDVDVVNTLLTIFQENE